ncbi:MAG: dTDP-glucose 4,6-dehydratase [Candidatus Margulisiibacteriota bacterium]
MSLPIIVTGGAGFIGSEVVRQIVANSESTVVTVDALTYAGSLANLADVAQSDRHMLVHLDIADADAMTTLFATHRPHAIIHLAAETHVDRSIDSSAPFIHTNIEGTYVLLEAARHYWSTLEASAKATFRFLHVSTDEVYGSLGSTGQFDEQSPYRPNSPYAASKAAADMLVRAWHHTYGLPTIITNCSNNYGPYQFPEKLIPLTIQKCLSGAPIPVYGKGNNVRDWLFVKDHARALRRVLADGQPGETYCISATTEKTNLEIVTMVCEILDQLRPQKATYAQQITFVPDRPGHDFRYALNPTRLRTAIGWQPMFELKPALTHTVQWYLDHQEWIKAVMGDRYSGQRLGTGAIHD